MKHLLLSTATVLCWLSAPTAFAQNADNHEGITPEDVAANPNSHTGRYLARCLER
jgi:hypothetical protein